MLVLVVGSLSWQWALVPDCWEGSLKSWKDPTPFPFRLLVGRRPVAPGFAGSRDKWYRGAANHMVLLGLAFFKLYGICKLQLNYGVINASSDCFLSPIRAGSGKLWISQSDLDARAFRVTMYMRVPGLTVTPNSPSTK